MDYSLTTYAGPDAFGRTFAAEPARHCHTRAEHQRRKQIAFDCDRRARSR